MRGDKKAAANYYANAAQFDPRNIAYQQRYEELLEKPRASVQPGHRQEHALHDPELVVITVERTFWHLWLPDGFALGKAEQ